MATSIVVIIKPVRPDDGDGGNGDDRYVSGDVKQHAYCLQ